MKTATTPRAYAPLLLIVALFGTGNVAAQEEIAAFSSLDESHAALVIGDVQGLVAGAGIVANQGAPGMGDMIRSRFGMLLGDPTLDGFEGGGGIAAVAFPDNLFVILAEVGESHRKTYQTSTAGLGLMSEVAEDLLLFSFEERSIETGKKIAAEVKETLFGDERNASLDLDLHAPRILDAYEKEIDAALASLPEAIKAAAAESATEQTQAESTVAILQAEIAILHSLLSQLDLLELEITPGEDGISLDFGFTPTLETNLAKLLIDSKGGDAEGLIGMLPADGAFRMEAAHDTNAFNVFLLDEMDVVFESLGWTEEEQENMKKWTGDWMRIYNRGFAGSMFGDSKIFLNGAFIYHVEDPEQSLQLFREMNANLDSYGILDLYKKMGMDMKFSYSENFGEHKGIPIHRMEMSFKMDTMGDEAMEVFMESFGALTYDLAIVENYLVYTMGDSAIGEVIDRVLEGGSSKIPPLASKAKFGDGGSFYMDLNIAGYLRMISNIMKNVPDETEGKPVEAMVSGIEATLSRLSGAPPVNIGLFADTERANLKLHVPSGLLQGVSKPTVEDATR